LLLTVFAVVTTMHHVEHGRLIVKSLIINIFDATFRVRKVYKQVTMKAGWRFNLGMLTNHWNEAYCRSKCASAQSGRSVSTVSYTLINK